MSRKKGFTLIEMVFVVALIGIFAYIAVPKLNFAGLYTKRAEVFYKQVVTSLRRARSHAISNAGTNTLGYSFEIASNGRDKSYLIRDLSSNEILEEFDIPEGVSLSGDGVYHFSPLGNLASSASPLVVGGNGKRFTITVVAATGMIKYTENGD